MNATVVRRGPRPATPHDPVPAPSVIGPSDQDPTTTSDQDATTTPSQETPSR